MDILTKGSFMHSPLLNNPERILLRTSFWRNCRTSASKASTFDFHLDSCPDTTLARCSVYSLLLLSAGFERIIAKARASFEVLKNHAWWSILAFVPIIDKKKRNKFLLTFTVHFICSKLICRVTLINKFILQFNN